MMDKITHTYICVYTCILYLRIFPNFPNYVLLTQVEFCRLRPLSLTPQETLQDIQMSFLHKYIMNTLIFLDTYFWIELRK